MTATLETPATIDESVVDLHPLGVPVPGMSGPSADDVPPASVA